MSPVEIVKDLQPEAVEPLLPIEKRLIGWSLGVGIVLLILLTAFNHLIPVKI